MCMIKYFSFCIRSSIGNFVYQTCSQMLMHMLFNSYRNLSFSCDSLVVDPVILQFQDNHLTNTLQQIESVIIHNSKWNCDLQFNENENPDDPPTYVDFSAIMVSQQRHFSLRILMVLKTLKI